jgi:hypothetical protein
VEVDHSIILASSQYLFHSRKTSIPEMPGKDEDVHPCATGPAKGLVDSHQEEQEIVFWSAWVSRDSLPLTVDLIPPSSVRLTRSVYRCVPNMRIPDKI